MWRWRVAMHAAFACSVRVCDMPFCVYFFSIVVVLTIDPAKFTVVSTRVTGPFSSCCGHRHLYFQLYDEMFMKCDAWHFEPGPLALLQAIARAVLGNNCVVPSLARRFSFSAVGRFSFGAIVFSRLFASRSLGMIDRSSFYSFSSGSAWSRPSASARDNASVFDSFVSSTVTGGS